jgi:RND family efflux transporter MFP subunit
MKTQALIFKMVLIGTLLSGCSLLPKEAEEPPFDVMAPVVTQREITVVKRGPIESKVTLAVSFGAERQQSLYLRTGGRLKKLHVQPGQHVEEGQLLLELEAGTLPYDVANAELEQRRKQLALRDAQAKKGFVDEPSASDLERYEMDLQQAQLALDQKRELLDSTRLFAPFAGRVLAVAAAEGVQIDAYKEVLVLDADGPVVARGKVDDSSAARLQVGQTAYLYPSDGNPTAVTGKVVQVPPAGTATGEKFAVIAPAQPSQRITAGWNGKAEVVVQAKTDALLVPRSAVRTFGGRQFVTMAVGETRQEVAVTLGLENDEYVEVTEGLKAGDQVVSR